MQITLKQAELEAAVRGYMSGMGIGAAITEISFTATRGSEGVITTIELGESPSPSQSRAETAAPVTKSIPSAPAADTNKEDASAKMLEEAEAVLGGPVDIPEPTEEEDLPTGKSLFD